MTDRQTQPLIVWDKFFLLRSGNVNLHVEKFLLMLPCLRHVDTIIRMFWAKVKEVDTFIAFYFTLSHQIKIFILY